MSTTTSVTTFGAPDEGSRRRSCTKAFDSGGFGEPSSSSTHCVEAVLPPAEGFKAPASCAMRAFVARSSRTPQVFSTW